MSEIHTEGLPLFPPGPAPFAKGSDTSKAAADRIEPQLSARRLAVFCAVGEEHVLDGVLADELRQRFPHWGSSTVTARLWDLKGKNPKWPIAAPYVEETQETRLTRCGSAAHVYRLTPWGELVYAKILRALQEAA